MTFKIKPQIIGYHCITLLVVLFIYLGCKQPPTEQTVYTKPTEMDSISAWILVGRDASKPIATRKSNLQKSYESAMGQTSDSIKLNYLSKIQWSFLKLKDTIWFRKTNEETNLLALKLSDSTRLAGSHWDLGWFFKRQMLQDSAFYHLSTAQKIYDLLGHNKNSAILLYDIAVVQEGIKDYTGSEVNIIKAIELLKPIEEHEWLYNCYNNLGIITKDLGDYKRALQYYQMAAEYLKKAKGSISSETTLANNIGTTYNMTGEFEKAISSFEKVLSTDSLRLKRPGDYARTLNNLAQSTYMLNDSKDVEGMFLESLKIRDSIQDLAGLAGGYFSLAEYYTYKKDTLKAIASARKSQQFAQESSNNLRLLESLGLLTTIDRQNASVHGQKYFRLNDSLQQEERNIRNKFARIQFETDEFIAENVLLARQKQLWTGIAIAIILLSLAAFIIINQGIKNQKLRFKEEQQLKNQKVFNLMLIQSENVEEGKKLEQKRVSEELHDGVLGKMLGARMVLLGLNKKMDPESVAERAKAIAVIQEIESEVRSISHELSHAAYQKIHNFILSIKDLITTVKGSSQINFEFNYTEELDWDALSGDIKINLYRIIQESIQNSVKHAACENIYLNFNTDESNLSVTVEDDGKGFKKKKGRKGIGIRNIASRMEKLNGNWDIESELDKGTKVKLFIPLTSNSNTNTSKDSPKKINLQEI